MKIAIKTAPAVNLIAAIILAAASQNAHAVQYDGVWTGDSISHDFSSAPEGNFYFGFNGGTFTSDGGISILNPGNNAGSYSVYAGYTDAGASNPMTGAISGPINISGAGLENIYFQNAATVTGATTLAADRISFVNSGTLSALNLTAKDGAGSSFVNRENSSVGLTSLQNITSVENHGTIEFIETPAISITSGSQSYSNSKFTNTGTITGGGVGLAVNNYAIIENTGTIQSTGSANMAAIQVDYDWRNTEFPADPLPLFINSGSVLGANAGVSLSSASMINSGTITATFGTPSEYAIALESYKGPGAFVKLIEGSDITGHVRIGLAAAEYAFFTTLAIDASTHDIDGNIFITNSYFELGISGSDHGTLSGRAITLDNVELAFDLHDADLSGVDLMTIMEADTITGSFVGLDDGAEINIGGKPYSIHYTGTSIYLEGVVPEPTACAAIFGLLALLFAARRRKK